MRHPISRWPASLKPHTTKIKLENFFKGVRFFRVINGSSHRLRGNESMVHGQNRSLPYILHTWPVLRVMSGVLDPPVLVGPTFNPVPKAVE